MGVVGFYIVELGFWGSSVFGLFIKILGWCIGLELLFSFFFSGIFCSGLCVILRLIVCLGGYGRVEGR